MCLLLAVGALVSDLEGVAAHAHRGGGGERGSFDSGRGSALLATPAGAAAPAARSQGSAGPAAAACGRSNMASARLFEDSARLLRTNGLNGKHALNALNGKTNGVSFISKNGHVPVSMPLQRPRG